MDMSVNIAGVEWKNPVTVASGTFGSGAEFADYVDINKLGAVTTKGVANVPWVGNPTPRVADFRILELICSAKEIFLIFRSMTRRLL